MTKRKIEYWVIPPEADGEFVANMEEVLETYEKAYDPEQPVVCMDEQPVQLIGQTRVPIPATKEHPERVDYEYERKGTASIFMFAEPLSGFRQATASGRAPHQERLSSMEVAHLLDTRYADVEGIMLVCDNLNTHTKGAFYEAFPPDKARDYVRRIGLCLHAQTRQLAQRGGVRVELLDQPMPDGPSDRRPRDAAIGDCRVVDPRQREATSRRLAIHDRHGEGETNAALSQNLAWTTH